MFQFVWAILGSECKAWGGEIVFVGGVDLYFLFSRKAAEFEAKRKKKRKRER